MIMVRVLLVDDSSVFRKRVRQFLDDALDIQVIAEAASGCEALRLVAEMAPDVVVLDLSMPDMNGMVVLDHLQQKKPELPVLILSMHAEEQYISYCIRAGAAGYLTKTHASDELAEGIRQISTGNRYFTPPHADQFSKQ